MNLPNYFLADLPPEARLSPAMLQAACETIQRNREKYLSHRSTGEMIELLADVAESWRRPDYRFRKLAVQEGPEHTWFSSSTLASGLDIFFKQITKHSLQALLTQEFGDVRRLDEMVATSAEDKTDRAAMVTPPGLIAHITAGNLPCSAFQSILLGVLLRSAQLVKCSSGASYLPRLFAHSLYDADHKLGACLELAEWHGGETELESVLFEQAGCVTASGSDEALSSIEARLPLHGRFAGYGHRISFGFVSKSALFGVSIPKVLARAATDIVAWDQLGCLSPHVLYIEGGPEITAEQFAARLAEELSKRELAEPRGKVPVEVAATIASRRAFYELRQAHSARKAETAPTSIWMSPGSTAWTVVYEADPRFQLSCLHRFIYVKGVNSLDDALHHAEEVRGKVSTVGLAAAEERGQELATRLARWGVTRVCPLGQMQNPPLAWRHDGRPVFSDWIQWTDWELK